MTYHVEYDGYYTMYWHDTEQNALKRWFDNYKIERYVGFATDCEWLVVKEVTSDTKHRKTRFICEIGDDGRGTKREVIMDHTAPPAPMLTFAAKKRYEPPPPKTAQQLHKEAEWNRMISLGYEPIRRPKYKPISTAVYMMGMEPIADVVEYEIEWVLRPPLWYNQKPDFSKKPEPKPPTHKRNV